MAAIARTTAKFLNNELSCLDPTIAKKADRNKRKKGMKIINLWWIRLDLNQGPPRYKLGALTN